ncbi:hypothetical protein SRO_0100 [Streptomyces rochei]|nr:hypothetical protein SRO_0100 [Streptomyces rochei]
MATGALGLECRQCGSSRRPLFFGVMLAPASHDGLRNGPGLRAAEQRQMLPDHEGGRTGPVQCVEF